MAPPSKSPGRWAIIDRLTLRRWHVAVTMLAAASFLGTGVWLAFSTPRVKQVRLTITGGSADGQRHRIAESLRQAAAPANLDLQVKPCAGSLEALQLVNEGKLDLALIQGGVTADDISSVRQLAVLHVEPLHLLIRGRDRATAGSLTIEDAVRILKAREEPIRINLGEQGSGTSVSSQALLRFVGLEEGSDYIPTHMSYRELVAIESSTELPDGIFTVSSLPSPIVTEFIHQHDFVLVSLPFANAMHLDSSIGQVNQTSRRSTVEVAIPAYTYGVVPAVPPHTLTTIGYRMHIIASAAVPAPAAERLTSLIYDSIITDASEQPLSVELLRTSRAFPLHPGTEEFLRKQTPVITQDLVDLTEQLLAIFGALLGGILFLWQGMTFLRRRRRDRQFLLCVERVGEIEQRTMQYERDKHVSLETLSELQDELNRIKRDMVQQFQSGDIEGADTLSGFLMHINDASENLTRLIISERENPG